jgi:serine phosphatase RsbU (regulator of sigma subunit)
MADRSTKSKNENARLKQEIVKREAELAIINSIQQGLSSHLEVQAIYDLVGDKICDIFNAQVVMISTYDALTGTIEHRYAIEQGKRVYAEGHFPIRGFRTQIAKTKRPVLVGKDVAVKAAQLGQPTLPGTITPKTWLGVPMLVGDQVTGILSLQNVEEENAFSDADVQLLQTLAASMSVALENAHLWEQEKKYLHALEHEFEVGRDIQAGFLPNVLPQPEGWEIAASLLPAREVAGDFYDVFELPDQTVGIVIADVCDKGLGAALFMTLFRSFIRAVSNINFYTRAAPGGIISTSERLKYTISLTNNYIAETHGNTGMFATVFFGIFEPHSGKLTYINCGHLPPMLIRDGRLLDRLTLTGTPLGAISDTKFALRELTLAQGDLLFAFTDGLTDTTNPAGINLGEDRLIPWLSNDQPLTSLLERIQKGIEEYSAGSARFDDITLLAVKRRNK